MTAAGRRRTRGRPRPGRLAHRAAATSPTGSPPSSRSPTTAGRRGRLRDEFGVLPPGDLRMALAALCERQRVGPDLARRAPAPVRRRRAARRARPRQPAHRRPLGAARRPRRRPRPRRPAAPGPGPGAADGRRAARRSRPTSSGSTPPTRMPSRTVRGQAQVAVDAGRGRGGAPRARRPAGLPASRWRPSASADWVVLGPGSWFTSVMPHLLVPERARGARGRPGRDGCSALNLDPDTGETAGFSAERPPRDLRRRTPRTCASTSSSPTRAVVDDEAALRSGRRPARRRAGRHPRVAAMGDRGQHDPLRLAAAFRDIIG